MVYNLRPSQKMYFYIGERIFKIGSLVLKPIHYKQNIKLFLCIFKINDKALAKDNNIRKLSYSLPSLTQHFEDTNCIVYAYFNVS